MKTAWLASFGVGVLGIIVGSAGCGSDGTGGGGDMAMSASGDMAQAPAGDMSMSSHPDLIGADVSCSTTSVLNGGDPIGSWTYVAGCADAAAFKDISDNCTATFSGTAVTGPSGMPTPQGNLTLLSGGTFTRTVHSVISTNATITGSCAAAGCANIQAAVSSFASGVTATCTGTTSCSCMLQIAVNTNDTGTWTKAGNVITANGGAQYTFAADTGVFRYRGDAGNDNGDRGVTYVLVK